MVIFPWLLFLIKGSIQFETKRAEKNTRRKMYEEFRLL